MEAPDIAQARRVGSETAAQARPTASPGKAGSLANRVLLHARPRGITQLLSAIDPRYSGILLSGSGPESGLQRCRKNGYAGFIAIDPRGYDDAVATPDTPFTLSPEGRLFPPSLEQALDDQRAAGADIALTPTRYIQAGDFPALKAAAKIAARLRRDDTVFSVPVDIAWLNSTYIGQFIAVLASVPHPKGVFLGSQLDPLDNVAEAVANLRRLCSEAGQVAILGTDFEAFDATAHGGFAASIGTGGSLRHIIPPGEDPLSAIFGDSPSVLVPDLIRFYKGSTLAKRFANAEAPSCACASCTGRKVDTFLGRGDSAAAHLHNIRTWMSWLPELFCYDSISERSAWWRNFCDRAVQNHQHYNMELGLRNVFQPTRALKVWADHSPKRTSPHPSR